MRTWTKIGLPLVTLGLAVVAAVPASAATAPVPVSAASALDSSVQKSVSVRCPVGLAAVGVAASTTRPWAVQLIGLGPDDVPDNRQATATARVFSGRGFRWQMTVIVLCVSRPRGLQYLSRTSSTPITPGSPAVGATTTCPRGKQLIGFGGTVTGGRIVKIMPQNNPADGIFLSAEPFTGTTGTLTVRSDAVCATERFPSELPAGLPVNSPGSPAVASEGCPSGMFAHAAAWSVDNTGTYVSDVTVGDEMTSVALTVRNAVNQPLSGRAIPFCVG